MKLEKYDYYALFFMILQILILIRNQLIGDHLIIFYYCDHIPLLFAIGFYLRKTQFIKGLISVGFILQLIYISDLISKVFFGTYITGTTAYLFSDSYSSIFALFISLLMHITVPIALFATYKEKTEYKSLITGILYLVFLYFSTIFLTPESYDMNCVFNGCGVSLLDFELYTHLYLIMGLLICVFPTFFIQKGIYFIAENKNRIPLYFREKDFYIGLYFLFIQLVILSHTSITNLNIYVWFCNHTPILFSLFFLTKNYQAIKALICVGFFSQLMWTIDLLSRLLLGFHLFNYTNYLWDREITGVFVALLIHLGTTFVALYFMYSKPVKKEAYFYSIFYAIFLFIITITLTDIALNVNCVQYLCGFENLSLFMYSTIWPFYAYFILFLPVLIIQTYLYKFSQKKK